MREPDVDKNTASSSTIDTYPAKPHPAANPTRLGVANLVRKDILVGHLEEGGRNKVSTKGFRRRRRFTPEWKGSKVDLVQNEG